MKINQLELDRTFWANLRIYIQIINSTQAETATIHDTTQVSRQL